jgi:hypothetical protein
MDFQNTVLHICQVWEVFVDTRNFHVSIRGLLRELSKEVKDLAADFADYADWPT